MMLAAWLKAESAREEGEQFWLSRWCRRTLQEEASSHTLYDKRARHKQATDWIRWRSDENRLKRSTEN